MSYLVLARKYRPKTFTEMVGQEHVVQALTNALTSQRLHHAYLFTGTRGVGKTTVSRILAKSLNCLGADGQGGITASPCGVCEACVAIDAGRFVDYTELDAASNRGVDEVQQLLEQAVYKPVQGRFKVFMIDEVHMLTNTAFNAMLKTLEEPPEYLKFVLATTDPQKVPVTVLSRCLQFNLRPMAPETVRAHLETILSAEHIEREPAALRLLAKSAHGSMRDGLSLTDQAIAFGDGALVEAQVRQMLGAVDDRYVLDLIGCLARGEGAAVIATVRDLQNAGLNAASTLEQMTDVLHRMTVSQIGSKTSAAESTEDEDTTIASLAAQMPLDEIQLLYSICLHGKADLGLASDEYAALTMVLLRLLAFKPQASVQRSAAEPSKKPEGLVVPVRVQPAPIEGSKTEIPAPPKVPEPAAPMLETTPLGDVWFDIVARLMTNESIGALVRELALQSQLMTKDAQVWTLQVDNALLANPVHAEKLQAALQTLEPDAQLQVQTGSVVDTPAKRVAKADNELQAKLVALIMEDATVQQLMREFDGRIVPNSIQSILPPTSFNLTQKEHNV
ncbi:MAG: DNA polymerase III subunit gamma/tau [Cytophagales bacterium]|nr:DNA polymerase III subunit gamma/tau [Cytophagales bacterium]